MSAYPASSVMINTILGLSAGDCWKPTAENVTSSSAAASFVIGRIGDLSLNRKRSDRSLNVAHARRRHPAAPQWLSRRYAHWTTLSSASRRVYVPPSAKVCSIPPVEFGYRNVAAKTVAMLERSSCLVAIVAGLRARIPAYSHLRRSHPTKSDT